MKKLTKLLKINYLLIISIILLFNNTYAQSIVINKNAKTNIKINENTYNKLIVNNTLATISLENVKTEKGNFYKFKIPNYSTTSKVGAPELPVMRKLIEVPFCSDIKINIIKSEVKEYKLKDLGIEYQIIPKQPSQPKNIQKIEFKINKKDYSKNAYSTDKIATVKVLGIMRGERIARLNIAPVQYNPVTNSIKVYSNITVELSFENADISKTIEYKKKSESIYFKALNNQLFNYKSLNTKDNLSRYPIKYVIVSDPMFKDALQPFIQWKTKKGFHVIEAYTDNPSVGNDKSSIKSYLQNLYDSGTPADPSPTFILFVGDVAQIPTFSGEGPTDLDYCEYTGDYFPEVYYGRFSATNVSELQPQIDKTLEYEQYLMADPLFLNNVTLVSGVDASHAPTYGNGQINYGSSNYFNAAHGITADIYLHPQSGNHSADIIQDVSNGVAYANYTAHGSPNGWANPSFTVNDIPGLQNQGKYPLMVGNACSTNTFTSSECFGEALLRAENKGAIGYIGASNSSYWDEDYFWGVGVGEITATPTYEDTGLGAYDCTFHDHGETPEDWYVTQDEMIFAGNLSVTQSSSTLINYYWDVYCLMGDPSLMVYFSQPGNMIANYNQLIPLASSSFTVNTNPYAYVAISKDGVLKGSALADETGIAQVALDDISTPGTADIVITKQNRKPHFGTVNIASPNEAYIIYNNNTINDEAGNNNGLVDYNESILLNLEMKNVGLTDGENISVQISSDDQYITITDNTEDYGTIPAEQTKIIENGFAFDVSGDIPDNHNIFFNVIATDGTDTWESSFTITGHAPVLEFDYYVVSDETGNNNDRLDPGETAEFIFSIKNTGSSDASNINGKLFCNNEYITLIDDSLTYNYINSGESTTKSYTVNASSQTPLGTKIDFTFKAYDESENLEFTKSFYIVIGQIPILITNLGNNLQSGLKMKQTLDQIEINYEYSTFFPTNPQKYNTIFVCLGIYDNNFKLSDAQGHALAEFLNNGGNLYLEGGDAWYYDPETEVRPMFNIHSTEDGYPDLDSVFGQESSFTEGLKFKYSGNNNWIDRLEPVSDAYLIFKNNQPEYGCAVANDAGTYKTIGTSFEFGGVTDDVYPNTKLNLMHKYLEFFGFPPKPGKAGIPEGAETVCEKESQVNYSTAGAENASSYIWEISPYNAGFINGNSANITINFREGFNGTAKLTVKGVNATGYGDTSDTLSIIVLPLPSATISGEETICQNDSAMLNVVLTGTPPWSVVTGNSETFIVNETPWTPWVKPMETTEFTIASVTDANNCSNTGTGSALITVLPTPVIDLGPDTAICNYLTYTFDAGADFDSYLWYNGSTEQSITIDSTGVGIGTVNVWVDVTNTNGCTTRDYVDLTFKDCTGINDYNTPDINIYPNPNKGSFNLEINSKTKGIYNIKIVNTFGTKVYQLNDVLINRKYIWASNRWPWSLVT